MRSCDDYHAQMLDYLYDLLEDDERLALQEHVKDCADCSAALQRAQAQKRLLAAAARLPFPEVRFEPPVTVPTQDAAARPFAPAARRPAWLPWAVAAGLLFALGLPAAWYWQTHRGGTDLTQVNGVPGRIGNHIDRANELAQTGPNGEPNPDTRWHSSNLTEGAKVGWGEERQGLQSKVWTDYRDNQVGEKILAHYQIKNVSKEKQVVWHSGFWPNHQIVVKDAAGKAVALTSAGKEQRQAFAPGGPRDKNVPVTLEPGQTDDAWEVYDLRQFFVLDKPGRYYVQYVYEESQPGGRKGRLESNVWTIVLK